MNPTTTLLHLLLIAATVMVIGTKTHAAQQPGPYEDMLHRQAVEAAVRESNPFENLNHSYRDTREKTSGLK